MKNMKNNFLSIAALIIIILSTGALYIVRNTTSSGHFTWSNIIPFVAIIALFTCIYFAIKRYGQRYILPVLQFTFSAGVIFTCVVLFFLTADSIAFFAVVNIFIVLLAFTTKNFTWIKFRKASAYILVFFSCFIFLTLHVWNIIGSRQLNTVLTQIKDYGYATSTQQVNQMYLKSVDSKNNGGAIVIALSKVIEDRMSDFFIQMNKYDYEDENQLFFTHKDMQKNLQKILSESSKELSMLQHALSYPQLIIPLEFQEPVYSMPLPHISALSTITKMLKYKFSYEIHKKQRQQAIETLKNIFKVSDMFKFEPILISQLVRYAIEKRTLMAIGHALNYEDDAQTIQQFIEIVKPRCEHSPSNFEGELLLLCSIFSVTEKETIFDFEDTSALDIPFVNFLPRGFLKQDIAYGLKCILNNVSLNKKGEKAIRLSFGQKEKSNNWYPISMMTTPYFSGINKKDLNCLAVARCVFTALHLRLQQLKSQQVDFTAIQKKYPLHTTDPFTGKSLLNTNTDNGYVIYSVGEDLKNGGGIITKRVDTGILLRKEK
ncbi:hypothetical protein [Candidatus Uabimicrobium amorphum]|uniref:Uncharacterized protein n=1 Tax=Uabimicrobium amorphum TaxID=2596890 RepID=A0A5S9F4M3_UABAM|nr:hypothetical protein [Candidatus Uabimicrobium amorphum]BBM85263.1 hypothetical protein UABAM_03626 [Candidatus Uabimicrobium amorphum]